MKRFGWQMILGISLVVLSAVLYFVHYLVFHDAHHIFIYMVGDVAFVPIEVLLVTLIIHRLLMEREKRIKMEKLNMVIGAFFSEVGIQLLEVFSRLDPNASRIGKQLIVTNDWDDKRFHELMKRYQRYEYEIEIDTGGLEDLKRLTIGKREFLLRLMENPNLLEHDRFTRLLRAVFHLTEELENRKEIKDLPDSDIRHLTGDARRVYVNLLSEWLSYMRHLLKNYPYLFSLAVRTNPFDPEASPVVAG
ncbi:MAG: hypothetical protein JSV33_13445 [bacterium]|nr:MAG: hypothetical protein JSV33_13445 [bacterium]